MIRSADSSAASTPYLPQHATEPLLRDFATDAFSDDKCDSPSFPPLPADRKARTCWRPTARAALPLTVFLLALLSLAYLVQSLPAFHDLLGAVTPSPPAERLLEWLHAPPERPLDRSSFVVVEPTAEHTVTAVVLHGLAGSPWDWPFVQTLAPQYPYVKWVSPAADIRNVTCRSGEQTRAWFDIETFEDLYKNEDIAGYVHSQQQLNRLVDEERQKMALAGKEPRIVMLGFSQGGVMSLLQLLTAREPDRFEAGVVFSAFLPLKDQISELATAASRNTPILWSHGRDDPYLTYEHAAEGVRTLRRDPGIGMERVTFNSYEGMGHSWAPQELQDLADWFGENVPEKRATKKLSSSPAASDDAADNEASAAVETGAVVRSTDAAVEEDAEETAGEVVAELEVKADLPVRRMRRVRRSEGATRLHRSVHVA
ncbi:hypothetical protein JCM10207_006627 [Rhodosporidiobolus poonsookiae]